MKTDTHRFTLILELFLIAAVVLVSYGGIFHNDFVYDDLVIVANNPHIHDLKNLPKIFTSEYFNISGERTYRPITTLTFFIDAAIWKNNTIGYHTTSIILHLITCLLIFFIARSLNLGSLSALAASLISASHPLISEAVIGITFREDLLAAVFASASLLAFLKWKTSNSKNSIFASWIFYFFAIFSKESAAALPVILLALEIIPSVGKPKQVDRRGAKTPHCNFAKIFIAQIGYIMAALCFLLTCFLYLNGAARLGNSPGVNFTASLSIMFQTFGEYLKLFFYPSGLCLDYIPAAVVPFTSTAFLFPAFTIAALLISVFVARKRAPAYSIGVIIFFIHLIPISNIVPFGAVMANRYMYLPAIGLCTAAAAVLQLICGRTTNLSTKPLAPRYLRTLFCISCVTLTVSLFSTKTISIGKIWHTSETLWADTIRCCPVSARAHTNYGIALRENGKPEMAVQHLTQAVALDPHYEAFNALGAALADLHNLDSALDAYRRAAELNPTSPFPSYNAGLAMKNAENYAEALRWFKESSRIAPNWAPPIYNSGNIYLKTGNPEIASSFYLKALQLDPDDINARGNLAIAYIKMGKIILAEQQLNILQRLAPSDPRVLNIQNIIRKQRNQKE
ncbi:MAG: tetratricopeptide repeat protein [bacterium]